MNSARAGRALGRILLTVAAAMAGFACASPGGGREVSHEIAVGEEAAGSTISLRPGQRLTVSLAGNPTTGFIWELLPGYEAVLEQQGKADFVRGGSAFGAGGVYRFAFKAISPGRGELKFVYRRPFEAQVAPASAFRLTVVVGE